MSPPWGVDRSRVGWWLLGIALGASLVFVLWSFVGTFVFGVFLYYATRPVYTRIRRRVYPPSLAAGLSLVVLALPALLILAYTISIGVQEFQRLAARYEFGVLNGLLGPYLDLLTLPDRPEEVLADGGFETVRAAFEVALGYLGFLGTAALHLFVIIALAFYLLRDDHRLSRWIRRRFADDAGVLGAYLGAVDRSFHQVFFGNILNAVVTGTIGAIAYNALNFVAPFGLTVPYPTLLGLLAGVASLVPIVGMKLVYVPVTAYIAGIAVLTGQPRLLWFPAAFGLVSFVIVDTIPDLVLRPYVSGRSLHVGMVMFAYIFGPILFGWYGIFLGPMLLVLIVHFARLVLPELITARPIKPSAVDPTYLTEGPSDPGFEFVADATDEGEQEQ